MYSDNCIRELRKRHGLSQAELGHLVGLHQTQIGNIEKGSRNLTFEWARRIAAALDCTTADLLAPQDNPWRINDDERELLTNFRHASDEQRMMIARVAQPLPQISPERRP